MRGTDKEINRGTLRTARSKQMRSPFQSLGRHAPHLGPQNPAFKTTGGGGFACREVLKATHLISALLVIFTQHVTFAPITTVLPPIALLWP